MSDKKLEISQPTDISKFEKAGDIAPTVTRSAISYGLIAPTDEMRLPCISFFAAGVGRVGMRNNCPECKKAVVMWSGVGVYRYRVNGFSEIVVDIASNNGQLIGEEPC